MEGVSKIKGKQEVGRIIASMSGVVRPRPKTSRQNPVRKSYGGWPSHSGVVENIGTALAPKSKLGSRSGVHFRHESDGYHEDFKERSLMARKYPGISPVHSSYERERIARKKKQTAVTAIPSSPRHKKNLTAIFRNQEHDDYRDEFSTIKKTLVGIVRPRKPNGLDATPASMSYIYKNPRMETPKAKRRYDGLSFDSRLTREISKDLEEDKGRVSLDTKR